MYTKFEKVPLTTVGEVDYTNSIPYNAKKLPKMTIKVQIPIILLKLILYLFKIHVHVFVMSIKLEKNPLKTVGGVDNINL